MNAGSEFDRLLGQMDGLPDVAKAGPSMIRAVPLLGVGTTSTYIVTTLRDKEAGGDTIALEVYADGAPIRLLLPPRVAEAIARQRDQLTTKNRSRASRDAMATRMARGEKPAFLRKGKRS